MPKFSRTSRIDQFEYDTGKFEDTVVVFNKVISMNDKYDIMEAYQGLPEWLSDELFVTGYMVVDNKLFKLILDDVYLEL